MVFGNNLIDFAANGISEGTMTWPSPPSPLLSTIGQYPSIPPSDTTPKKILPLKIKKTYTGLTFTVELDGDKYMGCGPQECSSNCSTLANACVSYPIDMSKTANETEKEIKSKLLKFLKQLRAQQKEQNDFAKAKAMWELEKSRCASEVKDGSTFRFVNADRNYAPVGPPNENWICQESIMATKPESEPEEDTTETEEESTSDSVVVAQTTTPIETASTNLSIGFSQGIKQTFRRGFLVGGVLLVGYGAYKIEDKTKIVSKIFKGKKKTTKTDATPKTTEANA